MKKYFDWKDIAVAYSLATLWFIISWKELLYPGTSHYLEFEPRPAVEYLSIVTNVLFGTLVFLSLIFAMRTTTRIWPRRCFQAVFFVLSILAFGPLSYEIMKWISPETKRLVSFPLPIAIAGLSILLASKAGFRPGIIVNNVKLVALFLLPFCLLIIPKALGTRFIFEDGQYLMPQKVEASFLPNRTPENGKKIVWIIFDEFDYSALTTAHLNGTNLPDVERLLQESFVAENAFSPAYDTIRSIPSLLTGKPIVRTKTLSEDDILLYPRDNSEPFSLQQGNNIFAEIDRRGGHSAIVGWYHPYARLFKENISLGYWSPLVNRKCSDLSRFLTCSKGVFVRALRTVPFGSHLIPSSWDWVGVEVIAEDMATQSERRKFLDQKANEVIADPRLDLVYFHFSVPHFPRVARNDLHGGETYFTSLEVVNDMIRQLRKRLEDSNQWDDTVLIISSDHYWHTKEGRDFAFLPEERKKVASQDRRIPFIVKFAGQKEKVRYQGPIFTVFTKRLILDIYDQKLTSSADLANWFDRLRVTDSDLFDQEQKRHKL